MKLSKYVSHWLQIEEWSWSLLKKGLCTHLFSCSNFCTKYSTKSVHNSNIKAKKANLRSTSKCQSQHKVVIETILVVRVLDATYSLLRHRSMSCRKKNKVLLFPLWAWRSYWTCDPDSLNKFFPQEAFHEVWIQLTQRVLKTCLKLPYYENLTSNVKKRPWPLVLKYLHVDIIKTVYVQMFLPKSSNLSMKSTF